jgi:hypothetical protein
MNTIADLQTPKKKGTITLQKKPKVLKYKIYKPKTALLHRSNYILNKPYGCNTKEIKNKNYKRITAKVCVVVNHSIS